MEIIINIIDNNSVATNAKQKNQPYTLDLEEQAFNSDQKAIINRPG